MANERAFIEQLKHEKKQLQELQQELLSKKANSPFINSNPQQVAQLQQILRTYQQKAKSEQQLLAQIQKELEHAKAQLDAHRKRAKAPDTKAHPAGSAAAKTTVVLQARLARQKQQLDKVVARNKAVRNEIDDMSKRGTAAQQLQEKLQKQLGEATAEAARLQQLVDTVEQAQQVAEALTEQLRLHNDAEQLIMSEAEKQLDPDSMSDQAAAAILQQLLHSLQGPSDAPTLQQIDAPRQQLHPLESSLGCNEGVTHPMQMHSTGHNWSTAAPSGEPCSAHSAQQWMVQQVKQLQEAVYLRFQQCSIANAQVAYMQQALVQQLQLEADNDVTSDVTSRT